MYLTALTFVGQRFGHNGVAANLVHHQLTFMAENGKHINQRCPCILSIHIVMHVILACKPYNGSILMLCLSPATPLHHLVLIGAAASPRGEHKGPRESCSRAHTSAMALSGLDLL